jgi:hypothetical protein
MIWRDKLHAACWHLCVTAVAGAAVAAVIFLVWFPAPFHIMMDGTKLFTLVAGCDLALGPLISLVIYNRAKSRRELLVDYLVVGVLQCIALGYGVSVVAQSRPVAVVFIQDRLEVISAVEIKPQELAQAEPAFRHLFWTGPQWMAVEMPTDVNERNDALFKALEGNDLSARPKFYRPYGTQHSQIQRALQPIDALLKAHPDAQPQALEVIKSSHKPMTALGWLPVKHRRGFWTVILDRQTTLPIQYLPIDPY